MKPETIEILRDRAEDLKILEYEEEEKLKEIRRLSRNNSIELGRLYFECYTILKENLSSLKEKKENNEEDLVFKELKEYFDTIKIDEKFQEDLEYYSLKKYGSSIRGEKIIDYVKSKRKDINKLVELFFEIVVS